MKNKKIIIIVITSVILIIAGIFLTIFLLNKEDNKKAKAPGMKYTHYSPDADVYIVSGNEEETIEKINALGIGPQGLGGNTTALGVNVETYPTHIAGMPVAVTISCHVTRHCEVII